MTPKRLADLTIVARHRPLSGKEAAELIAEVNILADQLQARENSLTTVTNISKVQKSRITVLERACRKLQLQLESEHECQHGVSCIGPEGESK